MKLRLHAAGSSRLHALAVHRRPGVGRSRKAATQTKPCIGEHPSRLAPSNSAAAAWLRRGKPAVVLPLLGKPVVAPGVISIPAGLLASALSKARELEDAADATPSAGGR
jgi:hypothetical protein